MRVSYAFRNACRFVVVAGVLSLAATINCRAQQSGAGPLPPSEARFAPGTSVSEIPFRVIDDIMYLTIRVNDSVEIKAAFDSGLPFNGVLVIDSAVGRKLGLKYVSVVQLGGAGDDVAVADVATGATVTLPGVSFPDQQVLVVRNARPYEKWLADGLIGGTMLNSCIVEIDHEKSVLRVYENGSFKADDAGEPLALTFSYGIPVVEATITDDGKSKTVLLLADTGADLPFSFHSSTDLKFQPPPNAIACYISEGIKGEVLGKWARMGAIHIGPYTMKDCLVAYPTEGFEDVEATLGQNGFFGLAAQCRFTVTFDYPHARMYLKPNSKFAAPFEFNMAGLVLTTLPGGLWEVSDVIQDSPGDAAGIQKGDLVTALDGRAASSISFAEMEKIFTREGRSLSISLKRDGASLDVPVTLKRII